MREKIIKVLIYIGKILLKGYEKKGKYWHEDSKCYVKNNKVRIIHPLGFLTLVFVFWYGIWKIGLKETIEEMVDTFVIF